MSSTCSRSFGILTTLALFCGSAWSQSASVRVTDYGAFPDGSDPAATTAAFAQAFAAATNGKVIVPPGDYAIDNAKCALAVNNFTGELKFEGRARLVFQTPGQPGIAFNGGDGARIIGLHALYSVSTGSYTGSSAIAFNNTSNTVVEQLDIDNSPGPGIYFNNAVDPKIMNATISGTAGEGVRCDNCRTPEFANISVTGSGNDGVLIWGGQGVNDRDGGHLSHIVVKSPTRKGISIVGQNHVTVAGFFVSNTGSSGLYCASESGTGTGDQILFQGGFVVSPVGFGIEFKNMASCSVTNVEVNAAANHGVYASAPSGIINVQNVRVRGAQAGNGFQFCNVAQVRISESTAENTGAYGFFFDSVASVLATGLKTYNVSLTNSLHRAIWFQNSASVLAFNLTVMDDQSTASGYILGTSNVQRGTLKSISSNLKSGTLAVQNGSTGVAVSLVN